MWKCPICDAEHPTLTVCPQCGFDGSCDYERYPTAFAVTGAKSTRALRREWEQKQGPGLDQLLMEWFVESHQKKDATAAERCFREKAEAGDAAAQWWLGASYQYGVGAKKDHRRALHWYRLAARQGSQPAQDMLQTLSVQAQDQQLEQRLEQLLEQAEQGDAQAQYEVGKRLWIGDGVDQDHKQAADWFDRAARQGLAAAQCALGQCCERGDGVERDMWQAAAWYQWAAQQGYAEAQLRLAECYEKGQGVPRDKEKAAEWLYKATQHGGSYVKNWLKTLKKQSGI